MTASEMLLNLVRDGRTVEASPELETLNWYKQILSRPNHHPLTEYQVREFRYLMKKYNQISLTYNTVKLMDLKGQVGKLSI